MSKKKNFVAPCFWKPEDDHIIRLAMRSAWPDWKAVVVKVGRSYGATRTRAYILRLQQNDEAKAA